jgi:pyrimidine operon attenuation protein/uracil phosphoribosyltransferase
MRLAIRAVLFALLPVAAAAQGDQTKMILEMTQGNWVAVRDWDGQDLVYFTHLESYRCGIDRVDYAINGGKLQQWELAKCSDPGAMVAPLPADYLPYTSLPAGSVEKVTVQITYPDGTTAVAAFDRKDIETP